MSVLSSAPVEVQHKLPPLKALTPLRFFAALYVVFFHVEIWRELGGYAILHTFIASGYTGVTLFFVLSGFILAYNYPQVTDRKGFWAARFARIYPVYALSLALFFFRSETRHMPQVVLTSVLSFGLVQSYWPPLASALNPAAWTLSVEAFFYALFPFLLPWIQRLRWRSFAIFQALYLCFVVAPVALALAHHRALGVRLAVLIESPFPLFRLNTFLVGVYACVAWLRSAPHSNGKATARPVRLWFLWIGAAGSIALLCLDAPVDLLPLRTLLLTYTYVLVIVGLADVDWPVLTNHWMQMAGEISYSIYILQFPFLLAYFALSRYFHPYGPPQPAIYLPLLILFSYAVFRWLEVPARLTLRRALTGRKVPTRPI